LMYNICLKEIDKLLLVFLAVTLSCLAIFIIEVLFPTGGSA